MLPPPLPTQSTNPSTCLACGKRVKAHWLYCGYCGKSLSQSVAQSIQSTQKFPVQTYYPDLRQTIPPAGAQNQKNTLVWITFGSLLIALIAIVILVTFLINNDLAAQIISPTQVEETSTPTLVEPTATQSQTPTPTPTPTSTHTPTPTNTPEPTYTPTLAGVLAIIPDPSEWKCQKGPSLTIYGYIDKVDSQKVRIMGMDNGETWFKTVSSTSGKTCWVPVVSFNRDSFVKSDVPIIETPEPPGIIYYGYKYAVCNTGWITTSDGVFIKCLSRPACLLKYPEKNKAFLTPEEALSGCKSSNYNYCFSTMPYTMEGGGASTNTFTCNIPRVDHSETDINYELFWLKLP